MKQRQKLKQKMVLFRKWTNKSYAAFNSQHKLIKICTLAVAYSLVAAPTQAKAEGGDTTSVKTYELDDVVVQSTLIELKSAETGRSIEVVSGAQLQSLPVTSIDELLRYIPGIDAQQRGAFGTQTDFSLRGSNFNQVLVLIDGQKINDPLTAHFNSNIPISPSEIERIEIIRGPASLEYGPDATGGVINILTKTFSKNKQNGLNANAQLFGGQYKQINSNAGIFYGNEKFRISGGGLLNKSDGNPIKPSLKAYYDIRDVSVSGQYQLSRNWSAAYRYAKDYRDFSAKNFYTEYASDSATEKVNRDRHQLQLVHSNENYSTQILASYISTSDYYLFRPHNPAGPNENTANYLDVRLSQQIKISNTLQSLLGATIQNRSVESNDRGNHTISHYGIFYTFSANPIPILHLNAGVREDYDENYGAYFLPQASASYKISAPITMRAAWGRSVRGPDFTENFASSNIKTIVSPNVPAVGNPKLNPEKSWNTEIGIDYKLSTGVLLSITGFNRRISDLIDYVKTDGANIIIDTLKLNPTGRYWFATNNSTANFNGIETRLMIIKKLTNAIDLNFIIGYTYLNFNFDTVKVAKYAALQPKHLINTQITLQYSRVLLSVTGLYKIRNELTSATLTYTPSTETNKVFEKLPSSYQVWNTSIDVDIYKHVGFLTLAVYNVFDQKYSDFLGAEMPGRWIAGGIKLKF